MDNMLYYRDKIAEPDNIWTNEAEQLGPTETVEKVSQNVVHTDEPIVMKSADPAQQAINDDTAESNKVTHSTKKLCKQVLKDLPNLSGTTVYKDQRNMLTDLT